MSSCFNFKHFYLFNFAILNHSIDDSLIIIIMEQSLFYKLEEKYDEFNKRSDFEHNIINTQSIQSDNLSIY